MDSYEIDLNLPPTYDFRLGADWTHDECVFRWVQSISCFFCSCKCGGACRKHDVTLVEMLFLDRSLPIRTYMLAANRRLVIIKIPSYHIRPAFCQPDQKAGRIYEDPEKKPLVLPLSDSPDF
jgi:hypothetical protein